MTTTTSLFTSRRAPCGRDYDGEHQLSEDGHGLVTDEYRFTCGCRNLRAEYHDGSVGRRVVRHDGKVLVDEEIHGE